MAKPTAVWKIRSLKNRLAKQREKESELVDKAVELNTIDGKMQQAGELFIRATVHHFEARRLELEIKKLQEKL